MFNFDFVYDALNLLLLGIMFYVGSLVSKGKNYWQYCFWIIISFTLVEGLRYGRGVDYMHYVDVYNYDLEEDQVLFTSLNRCLKSMGISAEFAFMFYAFPFIMGAMYMLKSMRKYAKYIFPLFLMSIIEIHESFVRQMLAMSFVFIYIKVLNTEIQALLERKIKLSRVLVLLLLIIISYSIHSVSIIAIFVITVVMVLVKKPFSWLYTIPLLLIGKFIVSKSFDFGYLNSLLSFIGSTNDKFSGYTDNADSWFSADAMNDAYTRSGVIQFLETFGCCALLYLGNKVFKCFLFNSKKNPLSIVEHENIRLLITLYNVFVIGIIILETFYNLELVRRVAHSWDFYWFVPMALVLYYRKKKAFNAFDNFLMLGFAYWLWEYLRFLFVWEHTPLFIWDK